MAGTREGGIAAAKKRLAEDPDYYKRIGSKGGRSGAGEEYRMGGSKASGFAADPRLASLAGSIGGAKSKRGKTKKRRGDAGS